MGIRKFEISLDNSSYSYYAGTNISGKILLWLDKPKRVRGIKIKISGKAYVSWERRELTNEGRDINNHRTVHYRAKERYINEEYFLEGGDHGKITIDAGYEHVYPFSKILPFRLPSSFEGKHGFIRYSITARLVRPWMFDVKEKIPFQVITPLDLNLDPFAKLPVNRQEEKTFFNLFHSSDGPLILAVKLLQAGYVPGQDIPITINVTNHSRVKIDSVELKLMKSEYWAVNYPRPDHKTYKTELVKKILSGVEAKSSKSFNEILNVGSTSFINLDECTIIRINFYIKVKACVHSIGHKGLSSKIPIIIGSVPVCNYSQQSLACPGMADLSTMPRSDILETNITSSFSERVPPPSYNADPPPYSVAISMPTPSLSVYSAPSQPLYGATVVTNSQFTQPSCPEFEYFEPKKYSHSGIYPSVPPPDEYD